MDEQQTTSNDWLKAEQQNLKSKAQGTFEQLPSLKLQPSVVTDIIIDFSKPFVKWTDDSNAQKKVVKAILPVTVNGVKMNWWLNVKNPVYSDIIRAGAEGQTTFKILQSGTLAQTKYLIVK